MWKSITSVIQGVGGYFIKGVAPQLTQTMTPNEAQELGNQSGHKFLVLLSAFALLSIFYGSSVWVLFYMVDMPEIIAAYVVLFTKVCEIFGLIISVYIGAQGLVALRYNSSSNASMSGSVDVSDITKKVVGNAKDDDYTLNVKIQDD